MKKISCIIFVLLLLSTTILSADLVKSQDTKEDDIISCSSEKYQNAYRYNIQGWIYLHIEGKPYERGYQHGYLLADEIVDHITRWSNIIHNSAKNLKKPVDFDSSEYQQMSNDWWESCRSAIKKIYWDRTPEEYQNEMKGIAEGVKAKGGKVLGRDVDYIDILTLNQMYEYMTRLDYRSKGFHPIKDLLNIGKILRPTGLSVDEKKYLNNFNSEVIEPHHCNAFIATGDATTNGQMVASQSVRYGGWWFPYYVAQRWNVIIDIVPEEGHRLTMASGPGFIWSNENYYQNEKGIVILETTLPQGLWNNKGYSMVIRTRRAIQYSDTLDKAIEYLKEGNDGLWTGGYLLGDTKTGEIARFELALYHSQIWRTFDGYLWIANNPENKGVRIEANGLGLTGVILKLRGISYYSYYTRRYFDAPRDTKFRELGEQYYGEIDIEVLKNKIMYEYPITDDWTTDIKATDTQLINTNSLWTHFGNAQGMVFDVSDEEKILQGDKNVPPVGWTLISGIPAHHNYNLPDNKFDSIPKNDDVLWEFDFAGDFEGHNSYYANLVYKGNTVFGAGLDGSVYALDASGEKLWNKKINNYGGVTWINADNDFVVVGWENKSCALDKNTGEIVWENNQIRLISSKPVFIDDKIIFGSRNGDLYAVSRTNGEIIWHMDLGKQKVYPSADTVRNRVIVASDDQCYAIDSDDRNIKWTFTTNDGMIVSPPLVVDNTVFIGSSDTYIYAVNALDGKLIWKNNTGWGILSTPAYSDNTVYVGSLDNNLYAFDAENGEMLWSFTCNAAIHSEPLVYGEYVFFGCDDGWFYAVNKADGEPAWCFAANLTINDIYNYVTTPVVGNSVAFDGKVFFSANGKIYGLDAKTIEIKKGVEEKAWLTSAEIFLLIIFLLLITVVAIVFIYASRKPKK